VTTLVRILAAPAIIALLAFAAPATAQTGATTPTLVANGEGIANVVPDIAIVTIGVTTRGATAAEALAANSADIAKVISTIQGEGVADKDIGTSGFSVFPVYEPTDPNNPPRSDLPKIVGYQVVNEVRVTVRDIATSGSILDKVVTAGANQVNGITFDIADRKTAADAALGDAIADARRQAEVMAKAAGVRLVRIVTVNASSGGMMPMSARFDMAESAVPVMPGQQEVRANASVTWEIAPE
jgi:uncharacterized protein YggE